MRTAHHSRMADLRAVSWGGKVGAQGLAVSFACRWRPMRQPSVRRLRLSRAQYVGMPRAQVEALMEAARRPAPDADPAGVQHGAGVQRMDDAAGAYLMEVPGVRGG